MDVNFEQMKSAARRTPPIAVVLWLAIALAAQAANTSSLPWDRANIATLQSLDIPAIAELVSDIPDRVGPVPRPPTAAIGEFMWVDLDGDGNYELLLTEDVNGRAFFNQLDIYRRDSSNRLHGQRIHGTNIHDLSKVVRDLDGDGKAELIIQSQLASDEYRGAQGMALWPAVYRQKDGVYIEASSEFRPFYESEVLPDLEQKIVAAKKYGGHGLAMAVMARDKVLRVIARDPLAGENAARDWMHSSDRESRCDAAAVFGDIGGHENELAALRADKDPSVALAAEFASKHGASSFSRFSGLRQDAIVKSPQ